MMIYFHLIITVLALLVIVLLVRAVRKEIANQQRALKAYVEWQEQELKRLGIENDRRS